MVETEYEVYRERIMDELKLAREQEEAEALEAVLDAEIARDLAQVDPGPVAVTPQQKQLYRFMRILQRYEAELTHVKEQSKAMIRECEAKPKRFLYKIGSIMQELVKELLGEDLLTGRKKSIKTSFGTAGFRQTGGNVVVKDWYTFSSYVGPVVSGVPQPPDATGPHPISFVRIKIEPDIKAINDHYKATGELLPGCDLEPKADKFYVE